MSARNERAGAASAALLAGALALAGCAAQTADPGQMDGASLAPTEPGSSATASAPSDDLATAELDVSWEDALQAAQDGFPGEPTEISLGREAGGFAYTVKLVSETEEYEAEISAQSGDIVSDRTEPLEQDDAAETQAEVFDPSGVVDPADALGAATSEVDGTVTEWSLDRSSHGLVYEVNIVPAGGGDDLEVKVDAARGEVLSTDR